jgi:putative protein-disulfide isomerase
MTPDLEFVYVGDPMCSWCWGFAPTLQRMEEVYEIPVRLVAGGLRPGPSAQVLDDGLAEVLEHHWREVERASGQPFDHAFLARRDGWRYDTELPDTAVVAMRSIDATSAIPFHTRLQRAFYAEGVDITDSGEYPRLVEAFGLDGGAFVELLLSEEMRRQAWEDFAEARSLGVGGFPTLLARDGEQWTVVTRGFAPAERLLPALSDWLLQRYTEAADGLFCEPGVFC